MSRAADVIWGIVLIGTLWVWMVLATRSVDGGPPSTFYEWIVLAGRVVLASYMSRSIYREYLR